jgi:hypothetical protein
MIVMVIDKVSKWLLCLINDNCLNKKPIKWVIIN